MFFGEARNLADAGWIGVCSTECLDPASEEVAGFPVTDTIRSLFDLRSSQPSPVLEG